MESKSRWSGWTKKIIMFVMMVMGGLVGQIVWEQIMQKKYKDNSVDLIVQMSEVIGGRSKLLYAQHQAELYSVRLADEYIADCAKDRSKAYSSNAEYAWKLEETLFTMIEGPTDLLKESIEAADNTLCWLEKERPDYGVEQDSVFFVKCRDYISMANATISCNDSVYNHCKILFWDKFNAYDKYADSLDFAVNEVIRAKQVLIEAEKKRDSLLKTAAETF